MAQRWIKAFITDWRNFLSHLQVANSKFLRKLYASNCVCVRAFESKLKSHFCPWLMLQNMMALAEDILHWEVSILPNHSDFQMLRWNHETQWLQMRMWTLDFKLRYDFSLSFCIHIFNLYSPLTCWTVDCCESFFLVTTVFQQGLFWLQDGEPSLEVHSQRIRERQQQWEPCRQRPYPHRCAKFLWFVVLGRWWRSKINGYDINCSFCKYSKCVKDEDSWW